MEVANETLDTFFELLSQNIPCLTCCVLKYTHDFLSFHIAVFCKGQEILLEKNLSLFPVGKETRNRAMTQTLLISHC